MGVSTTWHTHRPQYLAFSHRWHNHLCPEVSKEDWSQEEDDLIQELVQKMGTKWSKIVKMLPGRTDNAIKNRWNSTMRKNLRRQLKGGPNAENASGLSPEVLAQATMDACEQLPVRKRGSSTTAAVATAAAIAAVTSEISREASRAQARKKRGAPKEDVIAQRSNSPECVHVHHPADNVRTQEGSRVVQSSLLASAAAEEGMPSPAKRRAALPSSSATEKLDLSLLHVVVPLGNQAAEPLAVPRPPALSMGLVNSSYMDSVWASNHLPLSPPGSLLGSALHGLLEPQLTATDCYAAPPVEISSDSALPGLSPLQSPLNFMNFATGVGLDLGDRFHHNQEAADHVLKHELSVDVS
eukprot:scaffold197128_cov40-Tisochrysis_lutea.AAC.3